MTLTICGSRSWAMESWMRAMGAEHSAQRMASAVLAYSQMRQRVPAAGGTYIGVFAIRRLPCGALPAGGLQVQGASESDVMHPHQAGRAGAESTGGLEREIGVE